MTGKAEGPHHPDNCPAGDPCSLDCSKGRAFNELHKQVGSVEYTHIGIGSDEAAPAATPSATFTREWTPGSAMVVDEGLATINRQVFDLPIECKEHTRITMTMTMTDGEPDGELQVKVHNNFLSWLDHKFGGLIWRIRHVAHGKTKYDCLECY